MTTPPKFGKTGTHSMPKLTDDDEGDICIGISYDPVNGVVVINFGTPVRWIGLPPAQAIQLAQTIISNAEKHK